MANATGLVASTHDERTVIPPEPAFSQATSRQDLVLLASQLGIGAPVVAGKYAKLTDKWGVASPLRGKISHADLSTLETLVAEPQEV